MGAGIHQPAKGPINVCSDDLGGAPDNHPYVKKPANTIVLGKWLAVGDVEVRDCAAHSDRDRGQVLPDDPGVAQG